MPEPGNPRKVRSCISHLNATREENLLELDTSPETVTVNAWLTFEHLHHCAGHRSQLGIEWNNCQHKAGVIPAPQESWKGKQFIHLGTDFAPAIGTTEERRTPMVCAVH